MLEAEAIMHGQISRDLDCSFVAEEVLKMRAVMSLLVAEPDAARATMTHPGQQLLSPRRLAMERVAWLQKDAGYTIRRGVRFSCRTQEGDVIL